VNRAALAIALHAIVTLKAMVRMASAMLIMTCLSLGSGVASTRNSARVSPTCRAAAADRCGL
jgi:hypothetical protein